MDHGRIAVRGKGQNSDNRGNPELVGAEHKAYDNRNKLGGRKPFGRNRIQRGIELSGKTFYSQVIIMISLYKSIGGIVLWHRQLQLI